MSGYQYADALLEANYGFKESDIVKRLEQYTTLVDICEAILHCDCPCYSSATIQYLYTHKIHT